MTTTSDFWLGDRFVQPSLGEIQLGPERVRIEPRSMEVLLALVAGAPDVVPKQELIDAVWGEEFVTDDVLTHAIWDLRRAFGDNASDPEFIQTIPKRGYRLIAPVKPLKAPRRRASDRQPGVRGARDGNAGKVSPRGRERAVRIVVWAATAAVALVAALLWLAASTGSEEEAPAPRPAAVLLILPTEATVELGERGGQLGQRLASALGGLERAETRPAPTCRADRRAGRTLCLTPELSPMPDATEALVRVRDATTGRQLYATPPVTLEESGGLAAFTRETAELVGAFLAVLEDPRFFDPDFEPWIDPMQHDIRAIGDFLYGTEYVHRDEDGGRHPLDTAIERDRHFIAPRVYRTPTLMGEADAEALASHRAALESLYPEGSAFEKAMIQWAVALMDRDSSRQIVELEAALRQNPENRPVRLNLGLTHYRREEYGSSWEAVKRLVEDGWSYPPLYPLAALAALRRGDLDGARWALERAAASEPIDPNGLALLRLFAILDGDAEKEKRFDERYRRARRDRPADEIDVPELEFAASYLAAEAETRGHKRIAAALRESAH